MRRSQNNRILSHIRVNIDDQGSSIGESQTTGFARVHSGSSQVGLAPGKTLSGVQSPTKNLLKLRLKEQPRDLQAFVSPHQVKQLSLYDRRTINRPQTKLDPHKADLERKDDAKARRRALGLGQPSYLNKVKEILTSRKATAKTFIDQEDRTPQAQVLFASLMDAECLRIKDLHISKPSGDLVESRLGRMYTRPSDLVVSAEASPLHFTSVSWREVNDCSLGTLELEPEAGGRLSSGDCQAGQSTYHDPRLESLVMSVRRVLEARDAEVERLRRDNERLRRDLMDALRDKRSLLVQLEQNRTGIVVPR